MTSRYLSDIRADLLKNNTFMGQLVADSYNGNFSDKVIEALAKGQSLADLMHKTAEDYMDELQSRYDWTLQEICDVWGVEMVGS